MPSIKRSRATGPMHSMQIVQGIQPSKINRNSGALNMKTKQQVLDTVIEQIKRDIEGGDVTALYELLKHIEHEELMAFLPEY